MDWQIVCEVGDGSDAEAQQMKPDVILLDIGLPKVNGIEAARRIRHLSPDSEIVFISLHNSPDLVRAALNTGALGYVDKRNVKSELLLAIEAVLRGRQFVSNDLKAGAISEWPR
jgi:DNA-binding NarL/FixJ family response regulator